MTKIMLVEDDNNLREIYEARLLAEGYEIVSAKDGEEALALAVKEKPDLIISDVMMPKISGFDMLDILRSTPETKNTKVIMMTALSQTEDKARADKLGADRYLVKSQVTLEDVAKVAHEVLSGEGAAAPTTAAPDAVEPAPAVTPDPAPATSDAVMPAPAAPAADPAPVATDTPAPVTPAPASDPAVIPAPAPEPVSPAPAPTDTVSPAPAADPVVPAPEPAAPAATEAAPAADTQVVEPTADSATEKANDLANTVNKIVEETQATPAPATPEATPPVATGSSTGKKVIAPLSTPAEAPNLDTLLAAEDKKDAEEQAAKGVMAPPVVVADASAPAADAAPAPVVTPETAAPATPPGNVVNPNDPTNVAL